MLLDDFINFAWFSLRRSLKREMGSNTDNEFAVKVTDA